MAIAYRGGTANSATNGGNVALDLTEIVGLAEGDLVIVAYAIGDNDGDDFTMAIATGDGWAKIVDIHSDDSDDCDLGVFWKLMGVDVDTSVTVAGLGGTDAAVGAVALAFSGVDVDTPFDVTTTTAVGANTGVADPPSINFDAAAAIVVAVGAAANGQNATLTAPDGYTTNAEQATANDTTDIVIGIGYNLSPSDPEDPGAFTPSADNTGDSWCAATMALRPLAGVEETPITDTDTGTLADTETATVTAMWAVDTDTETLAEGITLAVGETAPYGGTLADTGAVVATATKTDTDAATLADTGVVQASATKADTEAGTLAETGTGTATTADSDTGTLASGSALAVPDTDTATLAETGAYGESATKTDTDAGTLADTSALAPVVEAETGILAESGSGAATTADSDASALASSAALAVPGSDTAALAEVGAYAATATQSDTDAGTLAESSALALPDVDTGSAVEANAIVATTADADTGTLADDGVASAAGDQTDTDTGTLAEAGSSSATTADVEVGTLAELPALAVVASDTGTGTEQPALALEGTDVGTLVEDGSKTTGGVPDTPITAADTATLTDTGAQFGSAPTADGTDTGALTESGSVVAVVVTVPAVRSDAVPMFVFPDYVAHPRLYFNGNDSDVIGLGEFAYIRKTTVAPSYAPPDPYGWLADTGDEEFAAVALLIG